MKLSEISCFTITELRWERIFLHIEIQSDNEPEVQFAFSTFTRKITNSDEVEENGAKPDVLLEIKDVVYIYPESYENGTYKFVLNMAAVNGRDFLDNGRWNIIAIKDGEASVVNITNELAYKTNEMSQIFRYGKNKYAYSLSFSVDCYTEGYLELCFNNYFMIANKDWKKRRYIQEAFHLPGKLKRTYLYTVIRLIRLYYRFMAFILPKTGKKILFMSETKDYLWGNLKYIHDRIVQRGLENDFDLTISCRKSVGNNKSAISWLKTVTNIARNDFIFIDDYAPVFGFFKLSEKTKLIQVWHAGEGFKSVGYSRFGKSGSPFPAESCHKAYDYVLTGSEKLIKVYEEVFGIEKEAFLPVGMPRLDDFLDETKIGNFKKEFYREYPNLKDKKVILFAPTFRGTGQKSARYDYEILDLERLYDFCGTEYVILFKMHPFVKTPIEIPKEYSGRLLDFAAYPNINDLYYITDLLITDYSSNYYEYALLRKPVLFFTYDRENYELTRGVHRSVKENAPGKVCDTFDEMMEALETQNFEYEKIIEFAEENFKDYDGHACDRVIDKILLRKEG